MAEQRTRSCGGCFVCAGRVVAPMESLTCQNPILVDEHGNDITDIDQLRQRAEAAEQEVARLRAGEADEPPAEGVQLTPAEWLRKYNDATPERRLQVVEHVRDNAAAARRCLMADHDGALDELRHVHAALARVRHIADVYGYGAIHAANEVDRAWGRQVLKDLSEALSSAPRGDQVTVRWDDLDLVMNGAGKPASWETYVDACQRIREALEGGQRG
ncbi:hypothetical protein [Nonomuraea sp. 10N515B]|uniref:hypothetical protein n=1 Tax=Nonomuraea sp. 10N515B TaxID=3457422 RepID=UPI003FCDB96C